METSLNILSILSAGLLIGTEFAVSAFVNPILAQIGGTAEARATQLFAKKLGTVMPFWYALILLLLIAQGIVRRHDPGQVWIVAAAVVWVAAIVLSILILVPINNRIAAMEPQGFTESLRTQHTRWDMLHRGRVVILAAAMVFLLVGIRV